MRLADTGVEGLLKPGREEIVRARGRHLRVECGRIDVLEDRKSPQAVSRIELTHGARITYRRSAGTQARAGGMHAQHDDPRAPSSARRIHARSWLKT